MLLDAHGELGIDSGDKRLGPGIARLLAGRDPGLAGWGHLVQHHPPGLERPGLAGCDAL